MSIHNLTPNGTSNTSPDNLDEIKRVTDSVTQLLASVNPEFDVFQPGSMWGVISKAFKAYYAPMLKDNKRPISAKVQLAVYRRDKFACQMCGEAGGNLTVDHVLPESMGGRHALDNYQTMCASCNTTKGDRI